MPTSRYRMAVAIAALLLSSTSVPGAAVASLERPPRPLRLGDYYDQVRFGAVVFEPGGSTVVYERSHIDRDTDRWTTAIHRLGLTAGDDRLLVANAASPEPSPDGMFLAFVRDSQVWLLPSRGGEPWPVTDTPEPVTDFDWAPDSSRLVIVTQDPRAAAPDIIPAAELSEAEPDPPPAVVDPASELDPGEWEPAPGQQPAAAPHEQADPPAAEQVWLQPGSAPDEPDRLLPVVISRLQFKADGVGYVGTRRRHLYVVQVDRTGSAPAAARQITSGPWDDGSPAWSPDGRWIAFTANRTEPADANDNVDLWAVASAGGEAIRLTDAPGPEAAPAWSADGQHLAYLSTPAHPPVYAHAGVWMLSLAPFDPAAPSRLMLAADPVNLTATLDRPITSAPRWLADGTGLLVTAADRGTVPLVHISTGLGGRAPSPAGVARSIIAGPRAVGAFDIDAEAGRAVASIAWGTQPAELFAVGVRRQAVPFPMLDSSAHVQPAAAPPAAELERLTEGNDPWLRRVVLAEPEPLRYTSADGTPVEGWLLRPPDRDEGSRLPLIVRIHGGPVSQYTWAFAWEHQWLAAQGYALLYVNPRGSSGYGLDFATALFADWGAADGDDVLAGVQHLLDRGVAHPQQVGVGGWSYGGILTNALITRSDRFAAAVSGASEADYFACYGTDDLQRWWESELGLPYDPDARALYRSLSPIEAVERVSTPTLFLAGEMDWRVPASQSEQFYAQLRRRMIDGGPATGLIVYPGQSHGGYPPSLSIDVLRRYRAWYDRHLKGDTAADPFFGEVAW